MASEGKHTPGPWEQDGLTVRSSRGIIAKCPVPQDGGTFDCQDNARLIAAAPETKAQRDELLAAIKELLFHFTDDGDHRGRPELDCVRRARAAIAKATAFET